jgi:hypothetical protein
VGIWVKIPELSHLLFNTQIAFSTITSEYPFIGILLANQAKHILIIFQALRILTYFILLSTLSQMTIDMFHPICYRSMGRKLEGELKFENSHSCHGFVICEYPKLYLLH